ncbi:uncharacterized protein BO72DRAFT_67909 [Aspergillus fijiensis CBS 313.89]|uniref:Uncharacterized protein n=1 Tax=Aspergillus fijiensis CBS 313.89 TaxID=1448319 RepID=A0A8G1VZU4_9EURO|nr:uncharacterized protein BO72DRAFT_67909 [Aspergillus fijiensis CBS 313.89]RAK78677.1 hypothetical protein BO72DRAFT_67909 [Aspergillus fijiensis CBS 313.89]
MVGYYNHYIKYRQCAIMTTSLNFLYQNQANLPNLRRLFVEARTEAEENEHSRTAVCIPRALSMPIKRIGTSDSWILYTVLQSCPLYLFGRCLQLGGSTNGRNEVGKMNNERNGNASGISYSSYS